MERVSGFVRPALTSSWITEDMVDRWPVSRRLETSSRSFSLRSRSNLIVKIGVGMLSLEKNSNYLTSGGCIHDPDTLCKR